MRRVGYGIGLGFLLLAAATLVAQLISLWAIGGWRPFSLSAMWTSIDAASLDAIKSLIENNLAAIVWTPIQLVLDLPAWISLAVPGAVLAFLCRPRYRGLGGF